MQNRIITLADCYLPKRKSDSHKGQHGNLAILGGTGGMLGAAILSARAGLLAGAGRTYLACLCNEPVMQFHVDIEYPEIMVRSVWQLLQTNNLNCLAIGPGLGQQELAGQLIREFLNRYYPIVLDADALNLVSQDQKLANLLSQRKTTSVITPHAGEAARLLEISVEQVQRQRTQVAKQLANRLNCVCVLKGYKSLIADSSGNCWENHTGSPGLAAAGTGDVLTGIISSFIAQGFSPWQASVSGVYLHGIASQRCEEQGISPIGLRASDVALTVRQLINQLDTIRV